MNLPSGLELNRTIADLSSLPSAVVRNLDTAIVAQLVNEAISMVQRQIPYNPQTHMAVDFLTQAIRHFSTHYVIMRGIK
jgi:hypothetical protein